MSLYKGLIGKSAWAQFNKAIRKVASDFFKKEIIHLIYVEPVDPNNEEVSGYFTQRKIEVLQNYNYMRTWPITTPRVIGDSDSQSVQIFINKEYLAENNYLTPNQNYDYNPGKDYFLIDGIVYKPYGDTSASQALEGDIFYLLILRREETTTSNFDIR